MANKHPKTTNTGETVVIDREAYERLAEARGAGESFSEVIKRCVRPRQSADEILRAMRGARISSSTLRSIEASAVRRRRAAHKSKG
jgi:predicted CopG family antitoxin